jgi:hypothetical protein
MTQAQVPRALEATLLRVCGAAANQQGDYHA